MLIIKMLKRENLAGRIMYGTERADLVEPLFQDQRLVVDASPSLLGWGSFLHTASIRMCLLFPIAA